MRGLYIRQDGESERGRDMRLDVRFDFKFKGERNYIHGTDIYNETLAWLISQRHDVGSIDFSFHHIASRQLVGILDTLPEGIEPVAICSFTSREGRNRLYVVETADPVTGRYSYPEDKIVSQMKLDLNARRCVLLGGVIYSDIEVWVAMTKAIHYEAFPNLGGKWIFARWRSTQYVRRSIALKRELHIASIFNNKLTRSEVFLDGQKAGEVYFVIV